MRILILDDDQWRHDIFAARYADSARTHTYNVTEFELALERGQYDLVLLDHDLGDFVGETELTGLDAAKVLAMSTCRAPVTIHSWNYDGARRMHDLLKSYGFPSTVEPFEA